MCTQKLKKITNKYYSTTQLNHKIVNLSITLSVPWGSICLITFRLEVRVVVLTKEKSNLLPGFVPNMLQSRDSHFIELFWLQKLSSAIMHLKGGA